MDRPVKREKNEGLRITDKMLNQYSWFLRPFFGNQRRTYGAVLEAALLWV